MKTAFIFFMFIISTLFLEATIINIPDDQPTIQAGINASANTDTILVQPGTYVENIDYNGKLITVASLFLTTQDTTYISQTIIDGNHYGSVVIFSSNEDSTAVLTGFTITNGYTSYLNGGGIYCYQSNPSIIHNNITENVGNDSGGGIYCKNSSPYLENLSISDNLSQAGGGISCIDNSNPRLVDVTITGNSTSGTIVSVGGGICCWNNSSPILLNVYIFDNTARFGGGICCSDSNPILINVTIENNAANDNGGGIYLGWYSNPLLMNVSITGNTADFGGGIDCYESSPALENVTITDNSADYDGGGIYCCYNSNPTLVDVLITGNSADEIGGGIYCYESSPILENVTISNNSASFSGGIGCYDNSYVNLINSILWNDSPQEIYNSSSSIIASYSNIEGGWAGNCNIDEDPIFVGSGDHPFMLDDLSPCVNFGCQDTTGMNLPEFDLAGSPRIYGGRIDMGAFENQNVIAGAEENTITKVAKLCQNHPNPFNPTTTIEYSIPQDNFVNLTIYNIKGQKVKELVSNQLSFGQHSVVWNGKDDSGKTVSSGIYFYKLKANNFEKTKKMILMK